ncbi:MAG: small basic protein [Candidatus Omnitrophica bacterium]|nr:small basic protein [Candidatus Omnitrophota bacterium]
MSQHPSLRSSDKDKAQRSVLKRYERVKILKDKDKWTEKDSVYKLPKIKIVKFKVKKEKAAATETAAEGAAAPAAPGAATGASAEKTAPAKGPVKPAAGSDAKKTAK